MRYVNAKLDAVCDELADAFEFADRQTLVIEAEKMILADCVNVMLFSRNNFIMANAKVANVTVHAIDYSIPHMDELAPPAWWEGRAEYICLKVCKQLKLKNNNTYPARCNWSFLTPEDKADFYRYFYESTNRETAYPVGYYFVKYLCDTYGEEVLGKIMENISNAQPRTGRKMEIFKECVTSVTDPDVFQNFVRDVVR
jgi:ABC-type transport system substrate-binding protein